MDKHEWSQEIEELLAVYKSYTVETSYGNRAKTANYCITTANYLYHEFSRSIRTGDLDLLISSLPKTTNYFFRFNQPN